MTYMIEVRMSERWSIGGGESGSDPITPRQASIRFRKEFLRNTRFLGEA